MKALIPTRDAVKVLVVGSGGREAAMVDVLAKTRPRPEIFAAPGNPGMTPFAQCHNIAIDNIDGLVTLASGLDIDLTLVGPETPLVLGIADRFRQANLPIIGPSKSAARLEGSKIFAKEFCKRHNIPTAPFLVFDNFKDARAHVLKRPMPCVIKADGLCGGHGVFVAKRRTQAIRALEILMVEKKFGASGSRVVVEDFLRGWEYSFFVLVGSDGRTYINFPVAEDYKRLLDNDLGPNTGSMGSCAPIYITHCSHVSTTQDIVIPTLEGMLKDGNPYLGWLYIGVMMTSEGPYVVEYNVRFGDCEAQVIFPLIQNHFLEELIDSATNPCSFQMTHCAAGSVVCVVLASPGYPENPRIGLEIEGINEAEKHEGVVVLHAGTTISQEGKLISAGGRVLNILGFGKNIDEALSRAYAAIKHIRFGGSKKFVVYRRDIGAIPLRKK